MSIFSLDRIGKKVAPLHFLLFLALFVIGGGATLLARADPRVALLLGFDLGVVGFLIRVLPFLNDNTE